MNEARAISQALHEYQLGVFKETEAMLKPAIQPTTAKEVNNMPISKDCTEVIFRCWRSDVIALFPYEIADCDGNCSSYMTVGQHGSANYDAILSESRPAAIAEYAELETELTNIGYNLKIVQRRHYMRYWKAVVEAYNLNNKRE